MRHPPSQNLLEKLTICLFFAGIALSVTHALWAEDVWWHLKTGEWIFQHRAVPGMNLYSYTAPDHPWIDLSWGFQLLLYLFYRVLGINGIIFFKVSVVVLTFFLLFRFFYRKLPLGLLLSLLTLSLLASHDRLMERPELLSFLFLVISLLLVETDRLKPTKWLYLFPFLQMVWANTHGFFALGLLVLGCACLGEVLAWLFSKKRRPPFPRRLCLIGLLSCLATFSNPYGPKGVLPPIALFGRFIGDPKVFSLDLGEFVRPFPLDSTPRAFFYLSLLILTPLSFLSNLKRPSFFHGLLSISFALLSFLAARNIAPFSFVACFVILKNFGELFASRPRLSEKVPRALAVAGRTTLLVLTLFLPVPFVTHSFYERQEGYCKRFGLGISEHRYCIRAATFIEKTDLPGNFFNAGLEVGDYLIWHLWPKRKVFMDGRLEAYGKAFFGRVSQLLEDPSLWPEWVETYGINVCILDHSGPTQDRLLGWLVQAPDWSPIYLDGETVLFMKKSAENQKILAAHTIRLKEDLLPPDSGDWITEIGLAQFYTKAGLLDKAESLYRRGLVFPVPVAMVYHNFGDLLRIRGKIEEALFAYRRAVRLDPNFGEAHFRLGTLYEKTGRAKEAQEEYRRVKSSHPLYLTARNALGILYAEKGELEKAEKEFKEILKIYPTAEGTRHNLRKLETLQKTRKEDNSIQK